MSKTIKSIFKIKSWNEEKIHELESGGGLRRAHIQTRYAGEFNGSGDLEYLMNYSPEGAAIFLGYEIVNATIAGKNGTFVFEHKGTFREGAVDSTWTVVQGSGSGELAGLSGSVHFKAGHQAEYEIELQLDG